MHRIYGHLTSADEDLMEMTPAKVFAGCTFEKPLQIHPDQAALLSRPATERFKLGTEVFGQPSRHKNIG